MTTKQFDEMCRKRNEIEVLRKAISFICWLETPKELRAIKREWELDGDKFVLMNCINEYCKDAIHDCLSDKLEELEKDFESYDRPHRKDSEQVGI